MVGKNDSSPFGAETDRRWSTAETSLAERSAAAFVDD